MAILPHGGTIYTIRNRLNGKVYFGQTIQKPTQRWHQHVSALRLGKHYNRYLQRAWNKHGEQSFEFCVMEVFASIEEMNTAEQRYIRAYRAARLPLYNVAEGGENSQLAEETKARIRAKAIGRVVSEETKAKHRGYVVSEETKAKHRAHIQSEEAKAKIRAYKHTDEVRAKMSATVTGRKHRPESIEKMRASKVGKRFTAEARANMSAAKQGMVRKQSEEEKAKRRIDMTGHRHSAETKEKLRAAHLARHKKKIE